MGANTSSEGPRGTWVKGALWNNGGNVIEGSFSLAPNTKDMMGEHKTRPLNPM